MNDEEFTMTNIPSDKQGIFNPVDIYNTSTDAFSRLRISQPFTLFDSFHRYRRNNKFTHAIGGNGTLTFDENESAVKLNVTGVNGDYCYYESRRVMPYQPGKSFLIMQSFSFANPQAGLRQRVGFFGTNNGVYLEHDGTTLAFVLRSSVTGSVNNSRRVVQANWNGHKFDGSAFYQRALNVTKANILWMDIEWLGVGDVRCGFIIDGYPVIAHTFHNENVNTSTYMTTAALPIRAEIENTSTTSTAASMTHICSTVISEGGYQGLTPINHAASTIITNDQKTLSAPGTFYPLLSIKLKDTRLDSVVLPAQFEIVTSTNDNFYWKLLLNPTLAGTNFTEYSTDSSVQVDTTATSIISTGTVVGGGFAYQKSASALGGLDNFNLQLGRTIQGTSDILTIAVAASANTAKCAVGLGWMELV